MYYSYRVKTGLFGDFQVAPYKPTTKQIEIALSLRARKYNIIRKSRQVGGTTAVLVEMLDQALNTKKTIAYVGIKAIHGRDILLHIISDSNIKDQILNEKRDLIEFVNGSKIKFISRREDFCSWRFDWVVLDEIAFQKEPELMVGLAMSSGENCNVTLMSTPIPKYNIFNSIYFAALQEKNEFHIIDSLWYDHPVFGQNVMWGHPSGKGFKIAYNVKHLERNIQLLSLGMVRTSEAYERHLKMYGMSSENDSMKYEMEAHLEIDTETAN